MVLSVFQPIMRWLICAAFGKPVVPPVKIRQAMSSSRHIFGGDRAQFGIAQRFLEVAAVGHALALDMEQMLNTGVLPQSFGATGSVNSSE